MDYATALRVSHDPARESHTTVVRAINVFFRKKTVTLRLNDYERAAISRLAWELRHRTGENSARLH